MTPPVCVLKKFTLYSIVFKNKTLLSGEAGRSQAVDHKADDGAAEDGRRCRCRVHLQPAGGEGEPVLW